jgi:hypothetical protein
VHNGTHINRRSVGRAVVDTLENLPHGAKIRGVGTEFLRLEGVLRGATRKISRENVVVQCLFSSFLHLEKAGHFRLDDLAIDIE